MKLITFLACIMMGLSIWSITARAQTANAQPAGVNPPSGDSFVGDAVNCPSGVCQKNQTNSKGCQTGFNAPTCQNLYDGKKGEEQKTNSNGNVQ